MFGKKSENSADIGSDASKLVDKTKALDERVNQEIKVHKMPAPYVSGRFDFQRAENAVANNAQKTGNAKTSISATPVKIGSASKSRQTGLLIMAFGVIVIGVLGYFAYTFLSKPGAMKNFSLAGLFGSSNNNSAKPLDNLTGTNTPINPIINTPETPVPGTNDNGAQNNASSTEAASTTSPEVINPVVIVPETPTSTAPVNTTLVDTDGDGLNNDEELLIGTDPNNVDSDFDGYEDLAELKSLYDPTNKGLQILANPNFKVYSSQTLKYSLIYPSAWEVRVSADKNSIIFSSPDQSFFQLVIQDNAGKQSIKDWYNDQFNSTLGDESVIKLLEGGEAIDSNRGTLVYATDLKHTRIYTLSYVPINENVQTYKEVFAAMFKSLVLK